MPQHTKQANPFENFLFMLVHSVKNNMLMKIMLSATIISFTNNVICRKNEVEKDAATGRIIRETQKNRFSGKNDGHSYTYYPNGDIKTITVYKDGEQDGLDAEFDKNGNTFSVAAAHYKEGRYVDNNVFDFIEADLTRFGKQPFTRIKKVGRNISSVIKKEFEKF